MNGLKVYLKSGITKFYFYAQGAAGALLILNALREYEHIEGQKLLLGLNVLAGMALILGWLIPRSKRRKFRFLSSVLLVLGGIPLIYLTLSSTYFAYFRFNPLLEMLGYLMIIVGLTQPLIDINQSVYFDATGMRHRSSIFTNKSRLWSEIKGIVFDEHGITVELINKRTIRMVPYDAESQNLRAKIDKMMLQAKAGISTSSNNGESGKKSIQHTPETV
jgi:hypothetical protein